MTYKDDLEEHLLVDGHVLLVPILDVGGLLARIGVVVGGGDWVVAVVVAPLEDLPKDGLVDLGVRVSDLRYGSKGASANNVHLALGWGPVWQPLRDPRASS